MRISLKKLDDLFRYFIRLRAMARVGGCERCLSPKLSYKELQTSHFHGRTKQSVRWNEDNAAGLCGACHMYFTGDPLAHVNWFRERLGEEMFTLLEIQARKPQKVDKDLLEMYLRQKIKEVKDEPNI